MPGNDWKGPVHNPENFADEPEKETARQKAGKALKAAGTMVDKWIVRRKLLWAGLTTAGATVLLVSLFGDTPDLDSMAAKASMLGGGTGTPVASALGEASDAVGASLPSDILGKYELTDGDGITQGLMKLRETMGDAAPQWLKDLDSPAKLAAWAEANNFYSPDEVKDSVIMHKGDVLAIDSRGNLSIQNADGSVDAVTDSQGRAAAGTLGTRGFSDTVPETADVPPTPETSSDTQAKESPVTESEAKIEKGVLPLEISDADQKILDERIDNAFGEEIVFNDHFFYGPGEEGLSKAIADLNNPSVADIINRSAVERWEVGTPEREAAERIYNFLDQSKDIVGDQSQNQEPLKDFFNKIGIKV